MTEAQQSSKVEKEVRQRVATQIAARDVTQSVKTFSVNIVKDLVIAGKLAKVDDVDGLMKEALKKQLKNYIFLNLL